MGNRDAVWVAHSAVTVSFAVINADDYYGPNQYKTLYDFLDQSRDVGNTALLGYRYKNTLSDYGTVNRGVMPGG
jgi:hypothetical protein